MHGAARRQEQPNVYARHGHELMGLNSPIIEPLYVLFKCTAIISERQLQSREALLRGSL